MPCASCLHASLQPHAVTFAPKGGASATSLSECVCVDDDPSCSIKTKVGDRCLHVYTHLFLTNLSFSRIPGRNNVGSAVQSTGTEQEQDQNRQISVIFSPQMNRTSVPLLPPPSPPPPNPHPPSPPLLAPLPRHAKLLANRRVLVRHTLC